MYETLTTLRLGTALVHALGGSAALTLSDGGTVCVGPEGHMSPCELRALVLMRRCPALGVLTTQLVSFEISGDGVTDLGGGLYERVCAHGRSLSFATLLAPATVTGLLYERAAPATEDLRASVRPDTDLGVVVVAMTGPPDAESRLILAARAASAACFTRELLHSVVSA